MRPSGRREPRPPGLPARIARALLPHDAAERLLADLEEEYVEFERARRGRVGADLWYGRQVLGSIWVLRRRRGRRQREEGSRMRTESWIQDVRFAARQLLRAPTFTVAAAATLALGIGATTAIFSVVHGVLLRSLPYDEPDRIIRAWAHSELRDISDFSFRVIEYQEIRERTDAFASVGGEFPVSLTVVLPDQDAQQVQGRMITSDFFRVFGVEPTLGRAFSREEIAGGEARLVIVSHGFWTRFLAGDPDAIGREIDVRGDRFRVTGVLPADYRHVSGSDAELFIPYTIGTSRWIARWLDMYARVQPGVSLERATDEINATMTALGETETRTASYHATVEPLHEMVVGDVRPTVWAVFAMVGLVLLVACVNVANLALARSTVRVGELAVRRALGAGRGRLLRQLAVESLLLSAVGGTLGLAVAAGALDVLVRIAPASIPRIAETTLEPTVLVYALAVTVATVLVFGLLPALRTTGEAEPARLGGRARGGSADRGLGRMLGGLVVAEVALAVTLLIGAGLMVRTMRSLQQEELGFDRAAALTFRVSVPSVRYPTSADTHAFFSQLRERLGALPGVVAVGAGTDLPVSGQGAVSGATTEERALAGSESLTVLQRRAAQGFFEALGTPIVAGRGFDERDLADGERVAVISESLARSLFGDRAAVGERVGLGRNPGDDGWMSVVGVVADVRYESVEPTGTPQLYQAHVQSTSREMAVVVRTTGDPMALLEGARDVVRGLDASVPLYSIDTLGGVVDTALAGRRFAMTLFALFAAVALLLTVAGIYGVLAFVVGQRRREIGLRMALGARAAEVSGLVLRRGAKLVAVGLALGLLGAVAAGRLIQGLLFGVEPLDPVTYLGVSLLITGVCVGACLSPAWAAARVDPMTTLREE